MDGNNYFSQEQIVQITGLQKGMEVTVPSEELTAIVNRLWLQRYFEDVAIVVDSIAPSRDTAFFKVKQMGDTSHLYVKGEPVSNSGLYNEIYSETSIDGAKLGDEL